MLSQTESKYPEFAQAASVVGHWTLVYSALRVKATRTTSAHSRHVGQTAHTGLYVTSKEEPFRWTTDPDPPKYVKEAAVRLVRQRRKQLGMTV